MGVKLDFGHRGRKWRETGEDYIMSSIRVTESRRMKWADM
jgi:hypothetical protein